MGWCFNLKSFVAEAGVRMISKGGLTRERDSDGGIVTENNCSFHRVKMIVFNCEVFVRIHRKSSSSTRLLIFR